MHRDDTRWLPESLNNKGSDFRQDCGALGV